jgi:hypothetical protein
MANYPAFSAELKDMLEDANRRDLKLEAYSADDACARWLAQGTFNFLSNRLVAKFVRPTDVVTWKILGEGFDEFDVQVGYNWTKDGKKWSSGRVTVKMKRAGGKKLTFEAHNWGKFDYDTSYMVEVIQLDDGTYVVQDVIKPEPLYRWGDWEV